MKKFLSIVLIVVNFCFFVQAATSDTAVQEEAPFLAQQIKKVSEGFYTAKIKYASKDGREEILSIVWQTLDRSDRQGWKDYAQKNYSLAGSGKGPTGLLPDGFTHFSLMMQESPSVAAVYLTKDLNPHPIRGEITEKIAQNIIALVSVSFSDNGELFVTPMGISKTPENFTKYTNVSHYLFAHMAKVTLFKNTTVRFAVTAPVEAMAKIIARWLRGEGMYFGTKARLKDLNRAPISFEAFEEMRLHKSLGYKRAQEALERLNKIKGMNGLDDAIEQLKDSEEFQKYLEIDETTGEITISKEFMRQLKETKAEETKRKEWAQYNQPYKFDYFAKYLRQIISSIHNKDVENISEQEVKEFIQAHPPILESGNGSFTLYNPAHPAEVLVEIKKPNPQYISHPVYPWVFTRAFAPAGQFYLAIDLNVLAHKINFLPVE